MFSGITGEPAGSTVARGPRDMSAQTTRGRSLRAPSTRNNDHHGVLVRDVSKYRMLDRCLRVNAGAPEENDVFLEGLRTIMREAVG